MDHFPGGRNIDLFFDSDMVNTLLKTNARRDRQLNYVIFVVWSAIIVGRRLVVAWGGNFLFSLAEISSLVFLVLFKERKQGELRLSSLDGLWSRRCCDHKRGAL